MDFDGVVSKINSFILDRLKVKQRLDNGENIDMKVVLADSSSDLMSIYNLMLASGDGLDERSGAIKFLASEFKKLSDAILRDIVN